MSKQADRQTVSGGGVIVPRTLKRSPQPANYLENEAYKSIHCTKYLWVTKELLIVDTVRTLLTFTCWQVEWWSTALVRWQKMLLLSATDNYELSPDNSSEWKISSLNAMRIKIASTSDLVITHPHREICWTEPKEGRFDRFVQYCFYSFVHFA